MIAASWFFPPLPRARNGYQRELQRMSASRTNPTLVALNRKVRQLKSDVKVLTASSADAAGAVGTQKSAISRLERENELLRQVRLKHNEYLLIKGG